MQLSEDNIKEKLKEFIDELMSCPDINEGDKYGEIAPVQTFIKWIEENQTFITYNKTSDILTIKVNEDTRSFMLGLLENYGNLTIAYPFLRFSFGLSSGELNYLKLFADLFQIAEKKEEWSYMNPYNLILLLDEAELTMHPRWQQKYCSWLNNYCNKIFEGFKIKIIVTTHSPILLSDCPTSKVIYIKNKDDKKKYYKDAKLKPFGSNITTLYSDSFFMDADGTIGKLAKDYINNIAKMILKKEYEKEELEARIGIIGEKIFRIKLKELSTEYYD
jgi:hypothetical protein